MGLTGVETRDMQVAPPAGGSNQSGLGKVGTQEHTEHITGRCHVSQSFRKFALVHACQALSEKICWIEVGLGGLWFGFGRRIPF